MENKVILKNKALIERIAELVARYEDEIADIRVEATIMYEDLTAKNKALEKRIENLQKEEKIDH